MSKSFRVFWLAPLLMILAACQQAGPSTAPIRSTAVPHTPTAIPAISSQLIGLYTTTITSRDVAGHPELDTAGMKENAGGMALPGTWTLSYRSDGIWLAQDSIEWGRQYIGTGPFSVSKNQVTLVNDSKCLEYYGLQAQSATYSWRLSGDKLVLQTASDFCLPRKIVLVSHPWTRLN